MTILDYILVVYFYSARSLRDINLINFYLYLGNAAFTED